MGGLSADCDDATAEAGILMSLADFLCAAVHPPPGHSAKDPARAVNTLSLEVCPEEPQDCIWQGAAVVIATAMPVHENNCHDEHWQAWQQQGG